MEIVKKLASGITGEAFWVRQDGKDYVLKVYSPKINSKIFLREVEALTFLTDHRQKPALIHTGSQNLTMEHIPGEELFELLNSGHKFDNQMLDKFLLSMITFLGWYHNQGWAHRDIKPENIIVSLKTGEFTLIDYHLATRMKKNHLAGTHNYIHPKLIGKKFASLEEAQRSDYYALGVVLYQMISGKFPFDRQGNFSGFTEITPYNDVVKKMLFEEEISSLSK